MKNIKHFNDFFTEVSDTIPNQAFTPRQIIEQFARNEVIPSMYTSTDGIDDSSYTDEQLVNDVIEFEDKIDAENHLIEQKYELQRDEKLHELDREQSQPAAGGAQPSDESSA